MGNPPSEESSAPPPPRASASPGGRRPRAPGAYLRLPLWQRFAISMVIAVALLTVMVIYVAHHNTNSNTSTNGAAAVQANRDAEILVRQDQAPRTARLALGLAPAAGIERAIHARIAAQVTGGSISGPLRRAQCRPSGPSRGSRQPFSCSIVAGGVSYPFLGVVDAAAHRVTYCKRDPPPVPSDNVPVSRRCLA